MHTSPDVRDLRIERILPYTQNTQGMSLEDLFLVWDTFLRDSSPDAQSPGLINWSNKDLFVDKWIRESGSSSFSYNPFGLSKIGKGRYEISGVGKYTYNRFIAVSDTRGVTGKIYIGATQPGAMVSVGVECFDADKNPLGNNGGFVIENFEPQQNIYDFFKSSAFEEAASGERFLKPNTRFVKLYIDVTVNPNTVFFDESELTTFELDERYLQIFGTEIDWNRAEFFYHEPTVNQSYTFKNDLDGRVKTLLIKNTGLSDIQVTFPATAKWQGGVPLDIIRPGRVSSFTFIKAGGDLFASVIEELE